MVFPELHLKNKKTSSFLNERVFLFCAIIVSFLLLWILWCFAVPSSYFTRTRYDPITFYDDPDMSYSITTRVHNWDQKREQWLSKKSSFSKTDPTRIVVATGSQPGPCENPIGDHLLIRLYKNKVDYCRIHGCDVFYNNALLDQGMSGYWAKYPVIRAAMMAHPEAEWIWWIDSDAIITDMDFNIPLEKYKDYNLVVPGWPNLIFEKKSWTGLNAGVFLIRNCQWSMDLLNRWASFGPTSPDYHKWGFILKSIFTDKLFPDSDDQTALAYIIVKEAKKWGNKIYIENEYDLSAYWVGVVDKLDEINDRYKTLYKNVPSLRKKHAEKDGESYRDRLQKYVKEKGYNSWDLRRPFVTHFTGCQQCSGQYNPMYKGSDCWDGMAKALNFGDNQVLRNFGYFHPNLNDSSLIQPI
ncbi:hypothetical protein RND81_11G212700 [Saponaria officinalis]|uniref:Uncharacterized protein n=1 Tax=Saponaria officinalis TaxID=3572 RepID=A0AAW1HPQ6_SAPOF